MNAKYLLPSHKWWPPLLPIKVKQGIWRAALEERILSLLAQKDARRWRKPGQLALLNCAMI